MPFQQFEVKVKKSTTEDVIIKTLRNYPNITKTMIASHVRPGRENWYDTLCEMVDNGQVIREIILRDSGKASVIYKLPDESSDIEESEMELENL